MDYKDLMVNEIMTIDTDDIRNFALKLLDIVPEYFFTVPASSSGKYHPKTDLGEGGLVRHSISVKKFVDHMLIPEGYWEFTDREKDLIRFGALFHDCLKSGTQDMYESNPHTNFNHPIMASAFIIVNSVELGFDYDSANFISNAIASHMGQWNTSSRDTGKLPTPKTPAQKILHLADYLASRKNITVETEPMEEEQ